MTPSQVRREERWWTKKKNLLTWLGLPVCKSNVVVERERELGVVYLARP
jgi:hypothetical protein